MNSILYISAVLLLLVSCKQQAFLTSSNSIDSDLDGIHDSRDNCPKESGSLFNMGCPDSEPKVSMNYNKEKSTDSDLDGVADLKDDCPFTYGSPFNQGCPFNTNPL